jgi:broad specificity phosphatase PhoE
MSFFRRLFGSDDAQNLRIIITRHGERADLAIGKQWLSDYKRSGGRDPRIPHLTHRSDFDEWKYDSPLTVEGERQSASIGRKLLNLGYPIDYCYSSPAYRAIQTANKILQSQGREAVPINIEPGI